MSGGSMYIYITRHGETYWNSEGRTQGNVDIPLNDKGIKQACSLAERLKCEGLAYIYSSDLDRAYRTAAIIGDMTGITAEKRSELREVSLGVWEGMTIKEINQRFPGQADLWHNDFSFSPQGGESINQLRDRVVSFVDYLFSCGYGNSDRILIVTHALTARVLTVELLGIPLEHMWSFRLDNTGISIVHTDSGKRTIVCINDTCHARNV